MFTPKPEPRIPSFQMALFVGFCTLPFVDSQKPNIIKYYIDSFVEDVHILIQTGQRNF